MTTHADVRIDLWTAPEPGRRGPKPRHDRAQILREAIAIADAEGLERLSMERLARALRLTPMALYRHVPGKAELVALMVDAGLGPPPPLRGSWRTRLEAWAFAMARALVAHPWAIDATGRLRAMGPNELSWLEAGMASLAETRLSASERCDACLSVVSVVRTFAQFSAASSTTGLSRPAWERAARGVIAGRTGYPELGALLRAPRRTGGLKRAVAWVLDGIATRA